jgi:cell division protein FtsN
MDGDRKLQYVLMGAATVIFGFSYTVGYFVGKEAGFKEAKKKFEVEKQRLLKTIAALSPVSQPRVENKIYVVDKTEKSSESETAEKEKLPEISSSGQKQLEDNDKNKKKPLIASSNSNNSVEDKEAKENGNSPEEISSTLFNGNDSIAEEKPKIDKESVEKLPKKEVEQLGKDVRNSFYLQVGVFKNRGNALKLRERLENHGFNAKVLDKGRFSVVIVGYFETKEKALEVKKNIKEKLKLDSIIRRRK